MRLTLPANEDTFVEFKLPSGKTVSVDLYELDMLHSGAHEEANKLKEPTIIPAYTRLLSDKLGETIAQTTAMLVLDSVVTMQNELKKKLLTSPEPVDSGTESPTSLE